jgi:hypothetical protein
MGGGGAGVGTGVGAGDGTGVELSHKLQPADELTLAMSTALNSASGFLSTSQIRWQSDSNLLASVWHIAAASSGDSSHPQFAGVGSGVGNSDGLGVGIDVGADDNRGVGTGVGRNVVIWLSSKQHRAGHKVLT